MTQEPNVGSACARVRGRLEILLDDGLGALEAARDLGHLEACTACAELHSAGRAWNQGLKAALEPEEADLAFAREGLALRLAASRPPRRRPWSLLRGSGAGRVGVAAAVAASALLALAILDGLGASGSPMGELVSSAVRQFEGGQLPEISWPSSPAGLWRGQ